MADEQLSLTIEQLSESVRTAMTKDDAAESLGGLTAILHKESEGYLHEVVGQIFRSLVPAFVMTDADFKTPASLSAPTKAMFLVKDACVDWVIDVSKKFPALTASISVNKVEYCRRLHMTTIADDDPVDDPSPRNADEDEEENEDDENTPPNGADQDDMEDDEPTAKTKRGNRKKDIAPSTNPQGGEAVVLDPVVALMERMAVRCPDKAEWRRGVCESLWKLKDGTKSEIGNRFVDNFLLKLIVSDKAAWRSLACEASCGFPTPAIHSALIKRCQDVGAGVRSAALKSSASVLVSLMSPALIDETVAALRLRVNDEKPIVRRAAVSVVDTLIPALGVTVIPLNLLEQLSLDESLTVRKASVTSIASLLEEGSALATNPQVAHLYANTVLQMVTDVETSVVEKVVESFETCFINAAIKSSKECPLGVSVVLSAIGQSRDSTEFARRILRIIIRKSDSKFNKQIGTSFERLVNWFLASDATYPLATTTLAFMEELVSVSSASSVASSKLFALLPVLAEKHLTEALIHLLGSLAVVIPKAASGADRASCASILQEMLKANVPIHLSLIHDVVRCINLALSTPKSFFQDIIDAGELFLDDTIVYSSSMSPVEDLKRAAWHVCLIGELASSGFMPSAKGLTAIEAIATNRVYRNGGVDHYPLPPSLRAAAMVAFGKVCLQKESIAKRAVSKFAAHLSREEHPVVRNNVLIVLGDLCVAYTGLVDQYLPWATTCLADPVDLIRFQAAIVISSLLAEDYIKFKGQIVFRLLYLLSDPNVKIKSFVESVFSRILFLRHSGSLKTLFAETVCALNGFLRHPAYQGAVGNKEFLLNTMPSRRKEIYEFMLTSIVTPEQKFNAMMQLSHSLLAAFVDEDATNGSVQIPEREEGPAGQVLIDTLWLLSHKAVKLSSGNAAIAAAPMEDDATDKEAREKKQFEAALQKKAVVENIVPLLIQLNTVSEQKRSPISRYVRECLKELVKDYKDEISRIIHSDSQLAQELLFDLGVTPNPEPSSDEPAAPSVGIAIGAPQLVQDEDEPPRKELRTKKKPASSSSEDEVPRRSRKKAVEESSDDDKKSNKKKSAKKPASSSSEDEAPRQSRRKEESEESSDEDDKKSTKKKSAAKKPASSSKTVQVKEEEGRTSSRLTRKRKP